jgi:hypothetical protein
LVEAFLSSGAISRKIMMMKRILEMRMGGGEVLNYDQRNS